MIQFNLLPDVKREYIKSQRIKRMVINVSFIAGAAALAIFLILVASVFVVQRKNIHDLSSDIQTNTSQLKNIPNINDALTVQTQLNSLSALHEQKPAASRLFGFLSTLTPSKASIASIKVDYTQNNMTITGNAPTFDVINTFVDALKFTQYTLQGQSTAQPAFSTVVLSSFSRGLTSATYTITLNYNPAIFNNMNAVSLSVGGQPQDTAQQPSIIFKKGS